MTEKISGLSLPVGADEAALLALAAERLKVSPASLGAMQILKKSIDARHKSDIRYIYTVAFGEREPVDYPIPPVRRSSPLRPVVVGLGPAGLFAAYRLAQAGLNPIVVERGQPVEQRQLDVEQFWQGGALNPESNVQFGEGGAGTFSDGKLTTGTKNPRHAYILEQFVRLGASEEIRYLQKPHIGTEVLRKVIATLRQELLALGCELRFGVKLSGIQVQQGQLTAVSLSDGTEIPTDACVLAIGHSARDTFQMLCDSGVSMEQKPFAIGLRIEHGQKRISQAQYGTAAWDKVPPADYKLACRAPNGRNAFTFCVCPGGEIVAAASEPERLVTNGMSYFARDGQFINGGLLVNVNPTDFGGESPLAGVDFQRIWEEKAFRLGGGAYHAPAQSVGSFLKGVPGALPRASTYRPGIMRSDLRETLPTYVTDTLRYALGDFERKVRGFSTADALLVGVETRSSSPVRITRDERLQALGVQGLYPTGEGAGYAGGIMSAATDGLMAAEAIISG